MTDPIVRLVRRELELQSNAGGMSVGMPKLRIHAAHIERLCVVVEKVTVEHQRLINALANIRDTEASAKTLREIAARALDAEDCE